MSLFSSNPLLVPPLKWHGGKQYLARRLVKLLPPHVHYVEPFAGGLAVLFEKPFDGVSEVVNDLNGDLTNFWRTLQDEKLFEGFHRRVAAVPFSEKEWQDASAAMRNPSEDPVERAAAFFIACRQSMSGRMVSFAPLSRTRTRRGMNEQSSAWWRVVDGLPEVHLRLRRVTVLNRPALDVVRTQDGKETLFYLDPPYLHETRATTYEYGDHEMTAAQHEELLAALAKIEGRFLLSGYDNPLYERFAKENGWSVAAFELPNNSASGKTKRRMVETIWANFPLAVTPADAADTEIEE